MHWTAAVFVFSCWAFAAVAEGAPTVLIDTQFGRETVPAANRAGEEQDRVTGTLPAGWADDSGWAPVWVEYSDGFEEVRPYTRIHVTRLEEGRCQLAHLLPDIEGESLFRLTFEARSPDKLPVEVGFRQQGTPYRFLWNDTVGLTPDWRTYSYEFMLQPNSQPIGLWINVGTTGTVDLSRLRLVQLDREDLRAEIDAKHPGGGPANLFRNTRLPLGLQSGWALDRDCSDGDEVVFGRGPAGPSGFPSLRVVSAKRCRLYSEPFEPARVFDRHTVSFFVRGELDLRATVLCDTRYKAHRDVRANSPEGWQRVSVEFQPELMAEACALTIEGEGDFCLDAFQAAAGAERDYVSPGECEVALACGEGDASTARILFGDEPAVVRWAVTGAPAGSVLRSKVASVYGDEADLAEVELPEARLHEGAFPRFHIPFEPRGLGGFRIEAWVENASGKRLSPYNELVVYRLRRPRYWGQDAPDSPFGVHTLSTTRHNLMAKAAGINWTRLHDAGLQYLGWYHLEPEPGEWVFYDEEILRYRRDGLKILGCLSTAPKWASHYPGYDVNGYFDRFYQPKDLTQYAEYCRVVCERYRDAIDAWDVWNEPWIWAWWAVDHDPQVGGRAGYRTSERPQADFGAMMQVAYDVAKSVNPDSVVLGVNSTTGPGGEGRFGGEEWTRGVVEAGGLEHCDVMCYHNYTGGVLAYPGDACEEGFATATGPIQEEHGGIDRPVWMTEGSAARELTTTGMYRHTIEGQSPEANMAAADQLCRYVVGNLAAGCEKVFLYSMHSHGHFGPSSWRTIVTAEGYMHPTGAGHSAMAWELEDTRFVRRIPVARDVFAYLFEARAGGRSVAVLAPRPGAPAWAPPAVRELTLRDVFGNPLAADEPLGGTLVYASAPVPARRLEMMLVRE